MNNQQNDDMDRQTLNVAFATQKGGSGKTAITVLVAGYLHYRLGCPLAVIDCDFPQYSLYEMRERDSRKSSRSLNRNPSSGWPSRRTCSTMPC